MLLVCMTEYDRLSSRWLMTGFITLVIANILDCCINYISCGIYIVGVLDIIPSRFIIIVLVFAAILYMLFVLLC